MTEALESAIKKLSKKNPVKKHLSKVKEECGELLDEVDALLDTGSIGPNDNILGEMADVLNTIEIYMDSVGLSISHLDEYRLKQVQKHL